MPQKKNPVEVTSQLCPGANDAPEQPDTDQAMPGDGPSVTEPIVSVPVPVLTTENWIGLDEQTPSFPNSMPTNWHLFVTDTVAVGAAGGTNGVVQLLVVDEEVWPVQEFVV
jgi:hypothetical protein